MCNVSREVATMTNKKQIKMIIKNKVNPVIPKQTDVVVENKPTAIQQRQSISAFDWMIKCSEFHI